MTVQPQHIEPPVSGLMAFDIVRIELKDLREFVAIAFKEDSDLLELYHFSDKTMEELISNNIKNIEELAKGTEVKCYGMFLEQTPIGFTVLTDTMLYSFGINVYCRQKEIVLKWFKWVKRVFENKFWVILYRENTRAINFFLRNGVQEFSDDGKVVCLLHSEN